MPLLLVIGAVALDRPVRLDGPLHSGGRLRARSLGGELKARLGGGAANAGCALLAAGHEVLVAPLLAEDADGAEARCMAEAAGLDLRLATTRPGASGRTLILIEPDGERTILNLDGSLPGALPSLPSPASHPALTPDGLLIRSPFTGAAEWAKRTSGPVLLHGTWRAYDGEADVLVASADDLAEGEADALFEAARAKLGGRLGWAVVTHGAAGARAQGPAGRMIEARPPPAAAQDATGAGDIFAAGLLDALVAGADMQAALAHGCAWGATAVGLDRSAPVAAAKGVFSAFSGQAPAKLT